MLEWFQGILNSSTLGAAAAAVSVAFVGQIFAKSMFEKEKVDDDSEKLSKIVREAPYDHMGNALKIKKA